MTAPTYAAVEAELLREIDPAGDHAEDALLELLDAYCTHVLIEDGLTLIPATRDAGFIDALLAWREGGS
jgi:hypothetical protein